MDQGLPFSSLPERWSEIRDFPLYHVSDHGRVKHTTRNSIVTPTRKPNGLVVVGLMKFDQERNRSVQHKLSLPKLVAEAFVRRDPRKTGFDTPIHLDGDRDNSHYSNLMWRPLWFSRKYMAQFREDRISFDSPVEDVETHIVYKNSMDAATTHGLLDIEIRISMRENTYVWPTGQVFREAL